ncbi:hypothetical protein MKW92_006609 [Papaver armeniacum]|nr:hypothetical protein MKW92_006609 [Papaver armeniacum]
MTRITSSYSNCHHAHILLTNVLMVLAVFTLSCSSTNSATPLESHDIDESRAMYIFGDSLVDAGKINYINPLTKNNNYPNGIDFPRGKRFTGRSTNGRTVVDIIGEELGLKDYIPPYLDPTTVGDVVLRGVNYACGGAVILNDTGTILGNTINMDAQVDNFANSRNYIISNLGGSGSKKLLEKALFAVVRLYELDARKIAVANVGPVGCIPIVRALYTTGDSCRSAMNDAAMLFNKKLKSLLMELNANLVESKFVYVDSYKVLSHIFDNYQSYGFEDFKTGCVILLADPTLGMASPAPLVCKDRSKHVFWDVAHPTEATYAIFAKKVLEDRGSTYTYPMNVRQLYYS